MDTKLKLYMEAIEAIVGSANIPIYGGGASNAGHLGRFDLVPVVGGFIALHEAGKMIANSKW